MCKCSAIKGLCYDGPISCFYIILPKCCFLFSKMLVCLPNDNATCEVIKLYPYYELQTLSYKVKYTVTHCYTVFYVKFYTQQR